MPAAPQSDPANDAQGRLAAIVESSDDAILSKTLEGIITSWNASAERLFGYTAEEMIGQSITKIIPPELQPEEATILQRLARGERIDHYETTRVSREGRRIPVSLTISPLRNAEGQIVGASKIIRDISHIKEAQQALAEAHNRLEHLVAERTAQLRETVADLEAFCYSLSHDMRAPLRALQSFALILQEDFGERLGPEGLSYTQRIGSAARRLDRLLTDVLALTQVARRDVHLRPIQLAPLLHALLAERPEFQPPRAEIEVLAPLLPILGHESLLIQCLLNLLGNAVKFVPPGVQPHLRIWTQPVNSDSDDPDQKAGPSAPPVAQNGWVRLTIQDNGIGIDPAMHQKIFNLFERAHSDQGYDGTGLGLAIVRKAADRMHGTISVESSPGCGSRFHLTLLAA
jgi:PAS domain S-box-containing protein